MVDVTVLSLMFVSLLSNSAYSLCAPFLPFEFARKNVPLTMNGYIFAMYSIAVIICSPLIGRMLQPLGSRRFI